MIPKIFYNCTYFTGSDFFLVYVCDIEYFIMTEEKILFNWPQNHGV